MVEYLTVDIKCHIDWNDSKEEINNEFGGLPEMELSFDSEIRYNYRKPAPIELFIFYPPENYLFEKFDFLRKQGKDIFSFIQIYNSGNPWEYSEQLDFVGSELLDIQEGHSEWKHRKKPMIIQLKNLTHYTSYGYCTSGLFYLTGNACNPIDEYSKYVQTDGIIISDKPVNNGTYEKYFNWGDMSFGIGFKHVVNEVTKHSINIGRIPYLEVIPGENDSDDTILEYASNLCLMMSLYWSKFIDYYWGRVKVDHEIDGLNFKERDEYHYVEEYIDDSNYTPWKEKYENFFQFITDIDYAKVLSSRELLQEVADRAIRSQFLDTASEFMLLYNVIEKIRNYYLDVGKDTGGLSIKEEYDFDLSKAARDKFINDKLKEIGKFVNTKDRVEYLSKTNQKVSFIRKTGLKDQFDSLVTYLGLSPKDYQINFIELINIRNKLYHGNRTETDLNLFIKEMRTLICDLLLKMLSK